MSSPSANLPVVLVVEDDQLAVAMVKDALAGLPCEVQAARGAEEALRLLRGGPVALVIADHYLDGMTGLDLLVRLHERGEPAVRILMSAHLDKHVIQKAVNRAGIFRVLDKPLDRLTLRIAACEALRLPVRDYT